MEWHFVQTEVKHVGQATRGLSGLLAGTSDGWGLEVLGVLVRLGKSDDNKPIVDDGFGGKILRLFSFPISF